MFRVEAQGALLRYNGLLLQVVRIPQGRDASFGKASGWLV